MSDSEIDLEQAMIRGVAKRVMGITQGARAAIETPDGRTPRCTCRGKGPLDQHADAKRGKSASPGGSAHLPEREARPGPRRPQTAARLRIPRSMPLACELHARDAPLERACGGRALQAERGARDLAVGQWSGVMPPAHLG